VRIGRKAAAQVAVVAAAVVAAVAPLPAGLVERVYTRGVYPPLQRGLTTLSNLTGLAIFDPLVIIVGGGLVWLVVARVRRARRRGWARALGRAGADLVVAAAIVYLAFLAVWGLNYRRVPLGQKLDFDAARVDAAALVRMLDVATGELNRLAPLAYAAPWPGLAEMRRTMGAAYAEAQADLGQGGAVPGRPKWTLLSWYFSRAAIDGMTDPFALEVLLNREVLPFERPFVVAHEWGHLAGYAAESEASFAGWLTCLRGGPQAQYSGWLALFLHLAGDVAAADARDRIARLDERPREDMRAVIRRVSRSTPVVRDTARRVYDRYLKANRVPSGVKSYDEVVLLVVGTRFEPGFRPVRRDRP